MSIILLNSHLTLINLGIVKMLKIQISLLFCFFMVSSTASALVIGVNLHQRSDRAISDMMKARNLKSARIEIWAESNVTAVRDQAARIKANGGRVQAVLFPAVERNHSCNRDLWTVEQTAYNETLAIVNKYKDVIYDYELLNEPTLRPETVKEVPFNSAMTATTPYSGKPCYKTLTAMLRGMANAVRQVRVNSGFPLRIILGIVGRDFGFLTYMQQQKVHFDVVGFIIYPRSEHNSLLNDPWYGAGGPFAQLAVFGRPVRINEYNCAEIYDTDYNNQPDAAKTKKCFQSYKNHIPSLFSQKLVKLEAVNIYELFDDPRKSAIESRFGLMYNINSPKVHLNIITAFAGGTLSAAEQLTVTNLGILSISQIGAYKDIARNSTSAP
jgi:hypothetical protein